MGITFFQVMITIVTGCLIGLWKWYSNCGNDISTIQEGVGSDWLDVRTHMWSTEIKKTLKRISLFIDSEKEENESTDFFSDLMLNRRSKKKLREHLDEMTEKYTDYKIIENSLRKYKDNNDIIKKWIKIIAVQGILTLVWAVVGIFFIDVVSSYEKITYININIFWVSFAIIIIIALPCSIKLLYHFNKKDQAKTLIEDKKVKYLDEMRGENNV